jgi:hypothetical protein
MKSPWLVIVPLAALAVAGCRTRPEQRLMFDQYQDELRRYEGIIYDLEYDKQVLADENARLKKRLEKGALTPSDRRDEGPSLFNRLPGRRGPAVGTDGDKQDEMELNSPDIHEGEAAPPSGRQKPVMPEADLPEEKPGPIPPPIKPPPQDTDPEDTEPEDSEPEDIDVPPGNAGAARREEDLPDAPPKRPASMIKAPGFSQPPVEERLPAPRPKPKLPELLPAPGEKKLSQISFHHREDTNGTAGATVQDQDEQRWTPRPPNRRSSP